jgi:hypothetical protein
MAGFASQISLAGSPAVYRVTIGNESGDITEIYVGGASAMLPTDHVEAALTAFAEALAQPPFVNGGIVRITTDETSLQ